MTFSKLYLYQAVKLGKSNETLNCQSEYLVGSFQWWGCLISKFSISVSSVNSHRSLTKNLIALVGYNPEMHIVVIRHSEENNSLSPHFLFFCFCSMYLLP